MKFQRKKEKCTKKPPLTNENPYDILLYCISMDKSPLPALRINKMNQICSEIWEKQPDRKKFIQKITLDSWRHRARNRRLPPAV